MGSATSSCGVDVYMMLNTIQLRLGTHKGTVIDVKEFWYGNLQLADWAK